MKLFKHATKDLNGAIGPIGVRVSFSLLLLCFVMMGCTLVKLKKEFNKSLESTVIIGRVYGEFKVGGPIIVAACAADKEMTIANYTVLHGSGEYELALGQGKYLVFAFQDKNGNLIYEAGERAGQHDNPKWVRVPAVGVVFDIDIQIPRDEREITIPYGTEIAAIKPEKLYSHQAGVITDLDDERFSEEHGIKGFWEYNAFFEELGGNIYFLEEYDPEKIPVLFIHGATGTPKGWQYFVDHIDRTRFQPWFFYYPTGLRIDSMAYLLLWKLTNLQTRYQFNQLYITAHSMGGLLARSFIVNYGPQFPYVKLFISLATPWGGDRMAELGVKQSPVVIPSWIDMQPEGDFIKSLYRKGLPEDVTFYMFSGYKGSRNPFRANNDGTITLSSILDYRPQSEAKMNYVFNEDHTSILFSKEAVEQYVAILDEFSEKESASHQRPGGHVKINFKYSYDFDGIRPRPILVLFSRGEKKAEIVTYLSNDDNGKIFGPYLPGDYLATMFAMAAKPQKNYIPVSIENNRTKELNFVFSPDGVIQGCVTVSLRPADKFVGRPDYSYRSVDETIHIQSIQLQGDGIQRTLQPIEGDFADNDYLISRKDYCFNQCFGFFGLPAGNYKLHLEARGYQPVEKDYTVSPGIPEYFRVTELTPDYSDVPE